MRTRGKHEEAEALYEEAWFRLGSFPSKPSPNEGPTDLLVAVVSHHKISQVGVLSSNDTWYGLLWIAARGKVAFPDLP